MTVETVERETGPLNSRWRARLRSGARLSAAIVVGLILGGIVLALAGGNPLEAYSDIVTETFSSRATVGLLLGEAVPLLTIGLGLAFAFRARLWNIGAEGQFLMGAAGGGAFVLLLPIESSVILVPGALIAGTVSGAMWGWIVGKLRTLWNVNEVISSLLLNYVAIFGMAYLIRQPLRDRAYFLPQSESIPGAGRLPDIPFLSTHAGVVIAALLVPVLIYVMRRTPFGFRSQMLGLNPDATRAAGVDTDRLVVKVMLLSGGLAGLAGVVQVVGIEFRLTNNLGSGVGFTAIIVALLGRMRPLGVLFASIFIATLAIGGDVVQRTQQIPRSAVFVLQALFVIVVIVADRWARG